MTDAPPPSSEQSACDSGLLARRGNELFRQLVDSVHDYAIFALDPQGTIATWSVGAQRIKGYRAEEALGRHFSMFYPAGALSRGWPAEELRRAKMDGRFEDEGLRVRKDGSTFWANVIISPLVDTNGELIGFSKVTRDLTERRENERRLEESERSQRLLIESVRDHAIFLLDPGGLIRTWNAGCARVFGVSAGEVIGKHVGRLYTSADQAGGAPKSALATAAAAGLHHVCSRRQCGQGATFPAEITTTALTDDQGELTGFVQVVRDMTNEDRVVALETEGKRINEFIAMLSHELRNPLAPIRNAVNLLQRLSVEPAIRRSTELINRQVTHLTRLVDDLMDVSRVTSGKIRIDQATVDIAQVVECAADAVRPLAQSHGHVLNVFLPDETLYVSGDASRLNQVFVNLLSNSAKYTPDGGVINISLSDGDGLATVKVTDTGIGMTDDLLQHAFDPFVQGSRSLDRAEGGLGIGLTLVKNIVQLHGGTVAAASAGLGQGTTVTVTIPTARQRSASASGEEALKLAPNGRAVLVVDDNEDAAASLADYLRFDGHRVAVVHDGLAALAAVQSGFPDLVILDIGLPGMNGHEVVRRMRQLPGGGSAHIVAVTGYGQDSDKQTSAAAGFDKHFVKPVDAVVLSRYLSSIHFGEGEG